MKISISNLILSIIFISITISMFTGYFQKLIFFEDPLNEMVFAYFSLCLFLIFFKNTFNNLHIK